MAFYNFNAAAKEDSMKTMFRSIALFSVIIALFGCSSSHDASSTSSTPGSAAYTANDAGTSVSVAVPGHMIPPRHSLNSQLQKILLRCRLATPLRLAEELSVTCL